MELVCNIIRRWSDRLEQEVQARLVPPDTAAEDCPSYALAKILIEMDIFLAGVVVGDMKIRRR